MAISFACPGIAQAPPATTSAEPSTAEMPV
jgi:hypothetical protein